MIQEYYSRDKYPDICIRNIISHLNAIKREEAMSKGQGDIDSIMDSTNDR